MIQPAGLFISEMRRETVEDKPVIGIEETDFFIIEQRLINPCLLYTSDAADEL